MQYKQQQVGDFSSGKESDLGSSAFNVVKDCFVRRITEATFLPGFHIVFKPRAKPLGTKVESVPKWFVNTAKRITTGHEDLASC